MIVQAFANGDGIVNAGQDSIFEPDQFIPHRSYDLGLSMLVPKGEDFWP